MGTQDSRGYKMWVRGLGSSAGIIGAFDHLLLPTSDGKWVCPRVTVRASG